MRQRGRVRVFRVFARRSRVFFYYACMAPSGRVHALGDSFALGAPGTSFGDRDVFSLQAMAGRRIVWSQLSVGRHAKGKINSALHLSDVARGTDTRLAFEHSDFEVTYRTSDAALTPRGAVGFYAGDEEKRTFSVILIYDTRVVHELVGNVGLGVYDVRVRGSVGRTVYTVLWRAGGREHEASLGG